MVNKNFSIKIDTTEVKKGLTNLTEKLVAIELERLKTATSYLESEAIKEAPSDSGELRASMVSKVEKQPGKLVGIVGNTAEYAPYVHQGTGKYAKNGKGRKTPWKVVTMYKGKKVVFVTRGQKSNPFLTRAKEKNMENIKKILGVK
ncbi:HK97-gp10 family putative phage morphogenesis protein [Helcococcus kunzii]|uniref:HK97-gp10 family putative phage morphogenesis protein n=1 Tax=Helcococcus kunzii TaxID=40091 RepID=UPI0038A78CA8